MPDVLANIALGFITLFTFVNLSTCLLGVCFGLLSGILPGMSPVILMGVLLPLTFAMTPITSMVLLVSIFNGAQYGASIKSIVTSGDDAGAGDSRRVMAAAWPGKVRRAGR